MAPTKTIPKPTAFDDKPLEDIFIAVLGDSHSAKAFIKDASGSVPLPNTQVNHMNFSIPFPLDAYNIQLVQINEFKASDTQNDADLLNTLAALVATLHMRGQSLRGIVYLLSLASPRIGGAAKSNLDILSKLCDKSGFKNTVFVTPKWSHTTIKSYPNRELQLKRNYLGEFITAGAQYFRHDGSTKSAKDILQALLNVSWVPLHLQTEVVEGGKLIVKSGTSLKLQNNLLTKLKDEIGKKELEDEDDEDNQDERQLFQDRFFQLHMEKIDLLWGLAASSDIEEKFSKMKELVLSSSSTKIFISVFGDSQSATTSFIELLSGSEIDGTNSVQASAVVPFSGKHYRLVNMPSFQGNAGEADTLNNIASYLAALVLGDHKLAGLVYIYEGSSASGINLEMLEQIAGTRAMRNLVVAAPAVTTSVFKPFLAYGAEVIKYNKQSETSAQEVIQAISEKSDEFTSGVLLRIQQEVVHHKKLVADTTAGLKVQALLMEKTLGIEKQLKDLWHKKDHHKGDHVMRKVEIKTSILEYQIACIKQSGRFGAFKDLLMEFENNVSVANAIKQLEAALNKTPIHFPGRFRPSGRLGNLYNAHFQEFGNATDLEGAVKAYDEAIKNIPADHPDLPELQLALGKALEQRFEIFGQQSDISKALDSCREAVQLYTNKSPRKKALALHALGTMFRQRFQRMRETEDIDNSVDCFNQAIFHLEGVSTTSAHGMDIVLGELCGSLVMRGKNRNSASDIDKGIDAINKVIPSLSINHPAYCMLKNQWCSAYAEKAKSLRSITYATEAIMAGEDAVAKSGHNTQEAHYLANLGTAYFYRYELRTEKRKTSEAKSDLEDAKLCFKSAAYCESANLFVRLQAAKEWAKCTFLRKKQPLKAFKCGIQFLPRIAGLALPIKEQHRRLGEIGTMVGDAVAAAADAKDFSLAVEWSEQGRSIVWTQLLQLRTQNHDLQKQEPKLASELQRLSTMLQKLALEEDSSSSALAGSLNLVPKKDHVLQSPEDLAEKWEKLVLSIRKIPKFQNFLLPKKVEELQAAASIGTVIIINAQAKQCDALILSRTAPTDHIKLPITLGKAKELQEDLASLLLNTGLLSRGIWEDAKHAIGHGYKKFRELLPGGETKNQDPLAPILQILWEQVTMPIIKKMKAQKKLPHQLPHIWWCPSGPFAFLPLHAAGSYNKNEDCIRNYFISSYTPTLSALLSTSTSTSSSETVKILAISQANAQGQAALPKTEEEVAKIQTHAKGLSVISLGGSQATVDSVAKEMQDCTWIHLACHGVQRVDDPLKSALILHKGKHLELREIVKMNLPKARFAFLSACQTATGDKLLTDEAVHLAGGMLLVGYQGVIATMWSMKDDDGPVISDLVYAELLKDEQPDHKRAAKALHIAVEHLRKKEGAQLLHWVPFIHIGL
ncbi:uncharacterized protein LACBIDRAFT_319008 [Laccaria bicolor S238N-H82]|uniref:Predicted protein n=1 Tax=Laccaria bicolor (strain S238N-H82 / ATCC MYA-4686) TaxID=486041 RepID=B0D7M9_LACBS|nr:uncharacterized protein LACBIDRAFT_319008 [Laccaria bicolor S238N-H82]EDR09678.1 predicted protein [Laccaria bicolor S238N-H82]|eukprot:XP_001880027.1 predicted protein [Laccaria bicolor S238N-H82]